MKKRKVLFLILLLFGLPKTARTDFWGADVVVLGQILVNAIEQLAQLRSMLSTGRDTLGLLRGINQGINDSLVLMQTISPNRDPGTYADWLKVSQALSGLETIYGTVAFSKDSRAQRDADQSAAEAVALNNSIYGYTATIDAIGEQIKAGSHLVSPAGAQKLTAQTLGVMLHVLNQNLRAQATSLKLQAQSLAIQNKKDKDTTRQALADSGSLKSAMKSDAADFSVPRF